MRIAILGPAGSIHIRRWVEGLAGRRHEVSYLNVSGRPREFLGATTVDVDSGAPPVSRFRRFWRRRSLLRDLRPDIVHQHSLPATLANLAFWRMPRLVVSSWGGDAVRNDPGDDRNKPFLGTVWQRFLLAQAMAVTATSHFLARETAKLAPRGSEVVTIPFGVDCQAFSPEGRREARGEGEITIGFIKHLESRYGPEQLLRAFADLSKRHPRVRLLMIGEGSLAPRLQQLAGELGVADRVRLASGVSHQRVPSVLAGIDVYVMPSLFQESFGVAALEASAMEVPVVATRVGGVPEVVQDKETGILVPPGDIRSLAAAIESLVEDASLRQRLGKQGRRWVLSRYSWDDSLSAMEELYSHVMAGSDAAAAR